MKKKYWQIWTSDSFICTSWNWSSPKVLKSLIQKNVSKILCPKNNKKVQAVALLRCFAKCPTELSLFKQQTQLRAASCRNLRADWESLAKNNKNMFFKNWIFKKILRRLDYLNIMSSGSPNESTASRLERIGRRSDANDRQEIDSDFVEENIGKF